MDTFEQLDGELGLGESAVDQRQDDRDMQHLVLHEAHALAEGLLAPLDVL